MSTPITHTATGIYEELRELAPSVVFSASKELDSHLSWDGNPEDNPRDRGMSPYDITVSAKAIVGGKIVEGEAYLGGTWMEPDEKIDDIGGYLPQKLEEAAQELQAELNRLRVSTWRTSILSELAAVLTFLKVEMQNRYDKQRAEIDAEKAKAKV